nr:MAG TPA: hypothetical protein [Caudoviricetes sp.]
MRLPVKWFALLMGGRGGTERVWCEPVSAMSLRHKTSLWWRSGCVWLDRRYILVDLC